MKRTSRILISVAAFFVACSNAFAAIEIDENIYNSADNAIVVSGKVTDSKANLPMGVIISKGGNVVFADYILAKEKEDGTIKFSFSPYVLPVTTSSADFEIKVFSDIEMEQQSRMYSYTGNDEKFLILKSLGTANNVDSTILNEGAKINLRASLYSCISDRSDLINKIAAIDLNLPEQCVTEDECKRVHWQRWKHDIMNCAVTISLLRFRMVQRIGNGKTVGLLFWEWVTLLQIIIMPQRLTQAL